jgi:cardiolipin synthase
LPKESLLNALRTAPNLLTLLRICLAPFLVAAILEGRFEVGLTLFIVAGLTDALDGLLARWLQQKTTLGQYLDPVADKLLLSTLFVVLAHLGLIARTITILVLGRDVGILLVAALLYAAAGVRNFEPGLFGKASTVAQIAAVAFVLLGQVYVANWVAWSRSFALDATVVLTILSGLQYAWRAGRRQTPATHI